MSCVHSVVPTVLMSRGLVVHSIVNGSVLFGVTQLTLLVSLTDTSSFDMFLVLQSMLGCLTGSTPNTLVAIATSSEAS